MYNFLIKTTKTFNRVVANGKVIVLWVYLHSLILSMCCLSGVSGD